MVSAWRQYGSCPAGPTRTLPTAAATKAFGEIGNPELGLVRTARATRKEAGFKASVAQDRGDQPWRAGVTTPRYHPEVRNLP
jgi:hypothetical protein